MRCSVSTAHRAPQLPCHTLAHSVVLTLWINLCVQVSVDSRAWLHVNNYVAKAEHTPDLQDPLALSKLKAAAGLALLNQKHYSAAARRFLECSSDHLVLHVLPSAAPGAQPGQSASTEGAPTSAFAQVVSAEDVATYACLCALATLEREELKARLVDSPAFKGFLELVPAVSYLTKTSSIPAKPTSCFSLPRHRVSLCLTSLLFRVERRLRCGSWCWTSARAATVAA